MGSGTFLKITYKNSIPLYVWNKAIESMTIREQVIDALKVLHLYLIDMRLIMIVWFKFRILIGTLQPGLGSVKLWKYVFAQFWNNSFYNYGFLLSEALLINFHLDIF